MKKSNLVLGIFCALISNNQIKAAEYNSEIGNGYDNANVVLAGPSNNSSSSKIVFSEGLGSYGEYSGAAIKYNSANGNMIFSRLGASSSPLLTLRTNLPKRSYKTIPIMEVGANEPQAFATIGNAYLGSTQSTSATVAVFGHKSLKKNGQYAIAQSSNGEVRISAPGQSPIKFYSGLSSEHTAVSSAGNWSYVGDLTTTKAINAASGNVTGQLTVQRLKVKEGLTLETGLGISGGLSVGGATTFPLSISALGYLALAETQLAMTLTDGYGKFYVNSADSAPYFLGDTKPAAAILLRERAVLDDLADVMSNSTKRNIVVNQIGNNTMAGIENTALGAQALMLNSVGNNNTAIGNRAGQSLVSGSNNILVGNAVNTSKPEASFELNIGDTIIGKLDTKSIAIGRANPVSTLDVNGAVTIRGGNPQAGYFLTATDKNGTAQWSLLRAASPEDLAKVASDLAVVKTAIGFNGSALLIPFNAVNGLHMAHDDLKYADDPYYGWDMRIGINQMPAMTDIMNSLAIGTNSFTGFKNASSNNNVSVGHYNALGFNGEDSYASDNVTLGNDNLTGDSLDSNIAIGIFTAYGGGDSTFTRNISIGNNSLTSFNENNKTDFYDNIALGYNALSEINDSDLYNTYRALSNDTITRNNIALGNYASYRASGSENIALGSNAYRDSFGFHNIAIGSRALLGSSVASTANITSSVSSVMSEYNIAMGDNALSFTHGHSNIALGADSGLGSKNGDIAFGRFSLGKGFPQSVGSVSAMVSSTNSIVDSFAGYSHNIALGHGALYHSLASDNIAIGTLALSSLAGDGLASNGNIAVGRFALRNNTSGAHNLVLGLESGASIVTGSNNILLGHHLDTYNGEDASNVLNIGNTITGDLESQRIAIGKFNPTSTLDVNGSVTIRGGRPQPGFVLTSMDEAGNAKWSSLSMALSDEVFNFAKELAEFKSAIGFTGGANGAPFMVPFNSVNGLHLADAGSPYTVDMRIGQGIAVGAEETHSFTNSLIIGSNSAVNFRVSDASTDKMQDFDNVLVGHGNLIGYGDGIHQAFDNVVLGNDNLSGANDLYGNAVIGNYALWTDSVSSIYNNVAIGTNSLGRARGDLSLNIAIGQGAMSRYTNVAGSSSGSNIAMGVSAYANSTGRNNIAIGRDALYSVSSIVISSVGSIVPEYNIGLGDNALSYTHGHSNIALGADSGLGSKNGDIAFGRFSLGKGFPQSVGSVSAMVSSTNSIVDSFAGYSHNIALGHGALYHSLSSDNIAIGTLALSSLAGDGLASNGNIAVGRFALGNNTSGAHNLVLGLESGASIVTGSNNILLGHHLDTYNGMDASNVLNIGNTITGDLEQQRIAIGKFNPTSTLDVNGSVTIRGGRPQPGYVLTSMDEAGNAKWSSLSVALSDEVFNFAEDLAELKSAIGFTEGVNGAVSLMVPFNSVNGLHLVHPSYIEDPSNGWDLRIGSDIAITTNSNQVFYDSIIIGTNSAKNFRSRGSASDLTPMFGNVLVGHRNMIGLDPGINQATGNIVFGNTNLSGANSIYDNVVIGTFALGTDSVSHIFDNLAIGRRTLSNAHGNLTRNIAIGGDAMYGYTNNISRLAGDNIAIGYSAYSKSTGRNNIAIGRLALHSIGSIVLSSVSSVSSIVPEYNIGLGDSALSYTHGHSNIAIAANSGLGSKNGDIAMGRFALGKANNFSPASVESVVEEYNSLTEQTSGYSHNIALGHGALYHSAAADNIAIGTLALSSLVVNATTMTGSNANIALGRFALRKNTTGAQNIVIGVESGNNIVSGNNNIIIGHHLGLANGEDMDSTLNIGGVIIGDLVTGRVGIGIAKPARTLHIKDVMRLEPIAAAPADAAMGDLFVHTSGAICFYNGDAWERMNTKGDCNLVLI